MAYNFNLKCLKKACEVPVFRPSGLICAEFRSNIVGLIFTEADSCKLTHSLRQRRPQVGIWMYVLKVSIKVYTVREHYSPCYTTLRSSFQITLSRSNLKGLY